MANMCTNMFYCKTDNAENYKKINDFLEKNFEIDVFNENEDNHSFEADFYSRWSFPEDEFRELIELLEADPILYMRILSHELCCEYVSFRIYSENKWDIRY